MAFAVLALLLALALDRAFGEPPVRWHPVVWMGRALGVMGRRVAPARAAARVTFEARPWLLGVAGWWAGALAVLALGAGVQLGLAELNPWVAALLTGVLLKALLAWRLLRDEVLAVEAALARSLTEGRERLAWLVSRDTAPLDEAGVRESALESLAENLNDSVVAPLFWFVLAGLPGAALYRWANTADAMWGYNGLRHDTHGVARDWTWAGQWAARTDDVLSWVPARLTAGLLLLAGCGRGSRRLPGEARRTPSPNGGWPMGALALVLGVRLRKPGVYELNPTGRAPGAADTPAAVALAQRALLWGVGLLGGGGMADVTDHGGADAWGVPAHDFSTNANACGPCPQALAAVQGADATRYPDPTGTTLKAALAAFHGVEPARVLLLASASEGMWRFSAWAAREAGTRVWLPVHHYGDLARAATAWGLAQVDDARAARLVWACEPSTPLGQAEPHLAQRWAGLQPGQHLVLDHAYEPLRLTGQPSLDGHEWDRVWRLISPNKALGLTGVRAAYALAPRGAEAVVRELEALAPSWPLGTHGEAMLMAWVSPAAQDWLAASRETLRTWKARQVALCESLGFEVRPSEANYFCARAPRPLQLTRLRQAHGVKLRDATSFGLPGWVRLGVRPPPSQDALARAVTATMKEES